MSQAKGSISKQQSRGILLAKTLTEKLFRRFRHVKRGTVYIEIGRGELQSDKDIREGDTLVAYVGEDGKIWLRPQSEFDDGRFEEINKHPSESEPRK